MTVYDTTELECSGEYMSGAGPPAVTVFGLDPLTLSLYPPPPRPAIPTNKKPFIGGTLLVPLPGLHQHAVVLRRVQADL